MEEQKNNKLSMFRKVLNNALFIVFVFALPVEFTFLFSSKSVLTEKSFQRINELNSAITKLSELDGKVFRDKEELKYNAFKIINPNFFDEYYFLEGYLFDYKNKSRYTPNIDELRKAGIDEAKLKSASKVSFYDLDSIHSYIKTLSNEKYFSVYSSYYSRLDYQEYFVRPLSIVILNNEDILKLKVIQDISCKSTEELDQAIKEVLGLEKFKQYSSFIISVKDDRTQWQKNMLLIYLAIFLVLIITRIIIAVLLEEHKKKEDEKDINENIDKAKAEIKEQPEKIKPVWDLANYTLQKYYNKNLSQVNSIYKLSIIVMLMGFLLIVSILFSSVFLKNEIKLESIGIIAGIITEFIGATFLFIYKSTIKQALQHSRSLEEINKVGMSIKIIESLEVNESNKDKIDDAKLEIAKELITTHNT